MPTLNELSLTAIDALVHYWSTDTAKNIEASREESAAVIQAVYAPVIETARGALEAAIRYDAMIQEYGASGSVGFKQDGTSYAVSDDLDALYADWINKSWTVLAQLGAPSPKDDDEPHPEFIRGYLAAADDLAEPYPETVSFFAPLTDEQIKEAVAAMGGDISGRLHAHWARHWADVLRKRSADIATSPVEGSWDWALSQIQNIRGSCVRLPEWPLDSWLMLSFYEPRQLVLHNSLGYHPDFSVPIDWFTRTDWRIADGRNHERH